MSEFGDLPDHMQVMVAGTVMTVASLWGVIKFIKPLIDHFTPKPPAASSTDAVVVSASLADSKAIARLGDSIDKMAESQEKTNLLLQMLLEAITRLTYKP